MYVFDVPNFLVDVVFFDCHILKSALFEMVHNIFLPKVWLLRVDDNNIMMWSVHGNVFVYGQPCLWLKSISPL